MVGESQSWNGERRRFESLLGGPRSLKHLAVDEDKTLQQLGVEALEMLVASRTRT